MLVVAEPGNPSKGGKLVAKEELAETYKITTDAFDPDAHDLRTGLFHKNVRVILENCFPGLSFEDKLKRVWFTESVLCSAEKTTLPIDRAAEDECAERYLRKQLLLFPTAVIAALGNKAWQRIERMQRNHNETTDLKIIKAYAAAPPGCNHRPAKDSWQKIIDAVHAKRRQTPSQQAPV